MVTTRTEKKHSRVNRETMTRVLNIFGKTLTRRTITRTVDNFGQLSAVTTSDTTFLGDLQFGLDLDQKFITSGYVEVGDAVLYAMYDQTILLQDQIIDGSAVWEVISVLEAPDVEGNKVFYTYRCKRRPVTGD